jgi:hypothetical protein
MKFPVNSRKKLVLGAAALAVLSLTMPASADIITDVFTGTGPAQAVKATFVIDTTAATLNVTIENTLANPHDQDSVITGILFTLVGGINSLGAATASFPIPQPNGQNFMDCADQAGCVKTATFDDDGNAPFTQGSAYGWTATGGPAFTLAAGNGSWKPAGIVNTGTTSGGSIPNAQHNDYLIGPVEFSFSGLENLSDIDTSSVSFHFGTSNVIEDATFCPTCGGGSQVPEPGAIILLGTGMVFTFTKFRKKFIRGS